LKTGFSNFASAFDADVPVQWAGLQGESAVGEVQITHIVPRDNFNTFFFAMTAVIQVVLIRLCLVSCLF
jgi:hypothetical protein